jgi:hypothetical protein
MIMTVRNTPDLSIGAVTAPPRADDNSSAANVVGGWLGVPAPAMVRQRNKSRAGYRKTGRKRGEPVLGSASIRSREAA